MISYDKIKIFFELKNKVHVSCDGRFYNGTIIEIYEDGNYLILVDNKLGNIPVMFDEILSIEPYMEAGQ